MDQYPPVAVIMPVLNEERHLAEAVAAIAAQDYPGELQIALALGPSTDRTDEVASVLHTEDPRVRLVSRIVDCAIEDLRCDMPVIADFRPLRFDGVDGEVVVPFFRPEQK